MLKGGSDSNLAYPVVHLGRMSSYYGRIMWIYLFATCLNEAVAFYSGSPAAPGLRHMHVAVNMAGFGKPKAGAAASGFGKGGGGGKGAAKSNNAPKTPAASKKFANSAKSQVESILDSVDDSKE